jgi:hypothetical protein
MAKNENSFTFTFLGNINIAIGNRLVGCSSISGVDKDSSARSETFAAAKVDIF